MRLFPVGALALLLAACDSKPAPEAPKPAPAAAVKPADETRRFPKEFQTGSMVQEKLLGKAFMPGGTLVEYKKGQTEYQMFAAKTANATDAALILPDWRKALQDAKLVPSFGAYYGMDAGRPVFVFSKGPWIAGVAGLKQKDAEAAASKLAAALD